MPAVSGSGGDTRPHSLRGTPSVSPPYPLLSRYVAAPILHDRAALVEEAVREIRALYAAYGVREPSLGNLTADALLSAPIPKAGSEAVRHTSYPFCAQKGG